MKSSTRHTIRFFWKHASQYKLLLTVLITGLLVATVVEMAWPVVVAQFFEFLSSGADKAETISKLLTTLFYLLLLEMTQWTAKRTFEYCNLYFQAKNMANVGQDCFDYLQDHSYRFFNDNFTGSLVKKVNRMIRSFEGVADVIVFNFIPLGLKILAVISVLSYFNLVIGMIVLAWTIVFLIINYALSQYKLRFDIEKSKANSKVTGALADSITNNINIKLFNGFKYESKRFGKEIHDWYLKTAKSWRISTHVDAAQALLMISLEIGILYLAIRLWETDAIGIGIFFIIQAYLFELFHQLWGFGRSIRNYYEHLADAEEMIEILREKHEIRDKRGAKKLSARSGKVEFKNVSFAYEAKSETVIDDLSFVVKPGMKVALIGPSGGGKSTVIRLLLRLYDLSGGKILIDGQDVSKVTQESLRDQIALVPQDPILLHRNLLDNIRYGRRDASEEEVVAAAKMAHCHEFIESFPKGYKTLVGERGVKLSGGQRQRIAIARAILSNAKILLLDEATSSLDSESEHLIQQALDNLIKNKTAFIIAHRLSTIMTVDQILVLKDGHIVETGTHADLVKKDGSMYKKLWDLQVGGYL